MAHRTVTLKVEVKPRWWLNLYLNTLVMFCRTFRRKPNMERVGYWINRGVVARLVKQ